MEKCPQCGEQNVSATPIYCAVCRWPFPGTEPFETYQRVETRRIRQKGVTLLGAFVALQVMAVCAFLLLYQFVLAPMYHVPGLFDL